MFKLHCATIWAFLSKVTLAICAQNVRKNFEHGCGKRTKGVKRVAMVELSEQERAALDSGDGEVA